MKYRSILVILLLPGFFCTQSIFSQSSEPENYDLKNVVISMKQGMGTPRFLVTIKGSGDIIYEGMDVVKTKRNQTEHPLITDERMVSQESDFIIVQKRALDEVQLKELVSEFLK